MSVIAEAEELALSLSESERTKLAEKLLISLRPILDDEDGGIEEAIRRDREMDENPESVISHEEFMKSFEKYRR
jgi:hypothetical protein